MNIGFVISSVHKERRVSLLPENISDDIKHSIYIEKGFGRTMGIEDQLYIEKGAIVLSKAEVYAKCEVIFTLKAPPKEDYILFRKGQLLIGLLLPDTEGVEFYAGIAKEKDLRLLDLDLRVFQYGNRKQFIEEIPSDLLWKNSFNAGFSAVMHALMSFGYYPSSASKIAVLGNGNVAQGAYQALIKLGADVRMFYRKTLPAFYNEIDRFDMIVNGIALEWGAVPIISKEQQKKIKKSCFVIDAAANVDRAIQGSRYTFLDNPIYEENGVYFYAVNNTPSVFYRNSSQAFGEAIANNILKLNFDRFFK
ncbi:MAG: hypothetical protein ACEPOW_05325 [Bacteroidales bacterium]